MKYFIKGTIYGNNERGTKVFKGRETSGYFITIKDPVIAPADPTHTNEDVLNGIKKELGAFTPKWVDAMLKGESVEYINLSSQYPSKVSTFLNIPDSAIIVEHSVSIVLAKNTYHNAIKVIKNGEDYDPFRGVNFDDLGDDAFDTIPEEFKD